MGERAHARGDTVAAPPEVVRVSRHHRPGNGNQVSEARIPEEETIETGDGGGGRVPEQGEYDGPDPEADPKGDGQDEDQGT
jgi:hypothetical protein